MQLASAIESGVAQAAALASTMSADDLANKWHERKQKALPASPAVSPGSPAGVPPDVFSPFTLHTLLHVD